MAELFPEPLHESLHAPPYLLPPPDVFFFGDFYPGTWMMELEGTIFDVVPADPVRADNVIQFQGMRKRRRRSRCWGCSGRCCGSSGGSKNDLRSREVCLVCLGLEKPPVQGHLPQPLLGGLDPQVPVEGLEDELLPALTDLFPPAASQPDPSLGLDKKILNRYPTITRKLANNFSRKKLILTQSVPDLLGRHILGKRQDHIRRLQRDPHHHRLPHHPRLRSRIHIRSPRIPVGRCPPRRRCPLRTGSTWNPRASPPRWGSGRLPGWPEQRDHRHRL